MIIAKHVLQYLNGTADQKMIFRKSEGPTKIIGLCDADWANSKALQDAALDSQIKGPLISWKSRKQQTIALSTCEAEYMSLAFITQEGKYLTSFLNEIFDKDLIRIIHCDN